MGDDLILCCGSGLWLKTLAAARIVEYTCTTSLFARSLYKSIQELKNLHSHDCKNDEDCGEITEVDYNPIFFSLIVAYSSLQLIYSAVLLVGSTKKISGLLKAWIIWCIVGLFFASALVIIRVFAVNYSYITYIMVDMFLDLFILWVAYKRLNEILAVRFRGEILLNDNCTDP